LDTRTELALLVEHLIQAIVLLDLLQHLVNNFEEQGEEGVPAEEAEGCVN